MADDEDTADIRVYTEREEDMPIEARVRFSPTVNRIDVPKALQEASESSENTIEAPLGTRLTMTSRTGYFQDRIISPSMVSLLPILVSISRSSHPHA